MSFAPTPVLAKAPPTSYGDGIDSGFLHYLNTSNGTVGETPRQQRYAAIIKNQVCNTSLRTPVIKQSNDHMTLMEWGIINYFIEYLNHYEI
jgi:hypothetical protein